MMKLKPILLTAVAFLLAGNVFADNIKNDDYKFQMNIPSGWESPMIEETTKKDVISYSLNREDNKTAILLIAFKVNSINDLTDFVYTIEKDVTLNIPSRDGSYSNFDKGSYDGTVADYRDETFSEKIYYFRTKYTDSKTNYAYVLRFITPWEYNDDAIQSQIKQIADSFTPFR